MTHDDIMQAVNIYEQNNENQEVKVSDVIVVKSFNIAKTLVIDYGFFKYLVGIHKDKYDSENKRRIWIFRRIPEVEEIFNMLVNEARQVRINKE